MPQTGRRHHRGLRLVPAKEFQTLSCVIIGAYNPNTKKHRHRFRAAFGLPPFLVAKIWKELALTGHLNHLGPGSLQPVHLLWALHFLKCCNKEQTNGATVGCDEKTFRKWVWFYCHGIANLDRKYIRWDNRFRGVDDRQHNRCLSTVDGTDFRIGEPQPFSKVWFDKKYNGAGLRYELVVSLGRGDIVGFNGPFAPRNSPDINIFRYRLKHMLGPGEQVIADKGYKGDLKCCTPYDARNRYHKKAMSVARARHETVNRCLKRWNCLRDMFWHHRSKHHIVFRAVVAITQMSFENGYHPFQLTQWYYEDPIFGEYY